MSTAEKYVLFPVPPNDQWAYDMYKASVASFWTTEEISFFDDKNQWPGMDENTKYFISHILAFFAASDGLVNENLAIRFYNDFDSASIKAFYAIQIGMETIHSQTYSTMIDAILQMNEEKDKCFKAIEDMPSVKSLADRIQSITCSESTLEERLLMMLMVEGVVFSSSFCAIYYLKKKGLLPGLAMANELIARDESAHAQFAVELLNRRCKPIPFDRVKEIVTTIVDDCIVFANESLPVTLIGMSAKAMGDYIRYVADYWVQKLNHDPIYNVTNPFDWMVLVGLDNKSNFFERRVSEYSKAVTSKGVVTLLEDF